MSTSPMSQDRDLPLEFRPMDVIRFLIDRAAPFLNDIYAPDSCIAQTNIACRVMRHFGIGVKPQPVRVIVWNDLAFTHWQKHGWHTDGVPHNYTGEQGRYSIAIEGNGAVNGDRWNGHLIAHVPSERLFVDMTLHQMSRPKWGINLEPAVVPHGDLEWDPMDRTCIAPFRTDEGAVIAYSPLPDIDPAGWQESPDWTDSRNIVGPMTAALIEWLERLERGDDVELRLSTDSNQPGSVAVVTLEPTSAPVAVPAAARGRGFL